MSFTQGFANVAQAVNSTKATRLDREVAEWRKKQASDEVAINAKLQEQRASQIAEELGIKKDELGFRKSEAAIDNAGRAEDRKRVAMRDMTDDLRNMGSTMRQRRLDDKSGSLIDAQIEAQRARARNQASDGYTTMTEEIDPETGEVISSKRLTRSNGKPAPTAPPTVSAPLDPTAQAAKARMEELQQEIAKDRMQQAQGDNRYGMNLFSRQGRIDDRNAQIGRLQQLVPTQPQAVAPAAQPAMAPQVANAAQQAIAWARANPNDPRAAAIIQRMQQMQQAPGAASN